MYIYISKYMNIQIPKSWFTRTPNCRITIRGEIKHVCESVVFLLLEVAFWGLKHISDDGFRCVDLAIWPDLAVVVWKVGFMVETL